MKKYIIFFMLMILIYGCFDNHQCESSLQPSCKIEKSRCGCYANSCFLRGSCIDNNCMCFIDADCEQGYLCNENHMCVSHCNTDDTCIDSKCVHTSLDSEKICGCNTNTDCPASLKCYIALSTCVECVFSTDCEYGYNCNNNKCIKILQTPITGSNHRLLPAPWAPVAGLVPFFTSTGIPYWTGGSNGWINYWTINGYVSAPSYTATSSPSVNFVFVDGVSGTDTAYPTNGQNPSTPFATITFAMAQITIGNFPTWSPTNPVMIYVGGTSGTPQTYTGALSIKPNVFIMGTSSSFVTYGGTGALTLDSTWSSSTSNIGGILYTTISTTASPGLNLDFSTSSLTGGKFYIYQSRITTTAVNTIFNGFSSNNYVFLIATTLVGFTQTGCNVYQYGSILSGAVTVADSATSLAYHYCGSGSYGTALSVTSTTTSTSTAYIYNCHIATGTTVGFTGTAPGSVNLYTTPFVLPAIVTYSGTISKFSLVSENNQVYDPSQPVQFGNLVPSDVQSALDYLAGITNALSSTNLQAITPQQIIWITKAGSDTTGNGSPAKPFISLTKALATAITLIPTITNRILINIGPGIYQETSPLAIPANVDVMCTGFELGTTIIQAASGTLNIAISGSSWTSTGADKSGFQYCIFGGATATPVTFTLDFTATTTPSQNGQFYVINSDIYGHSAAIAISYKSQTANNIVQLDGNNLFTADIYLLAGGKLNLFKNMLDSGTELCVGQIAYGPICTGTVSTSTLACVVNLNGNQLSSSSYYGAAATQTITATITSSPTVLTASTYQFLAASGGSISVSIDAVSLPYASAISTSGAGTTTITRLTSGTSIRYQSTTTTDWMSIPTTVSQAIDMLAPIQLGSYVTWSSSTTLSASASTIQWATTVSVPAFRGTYTGGASGGIYMAQVMCIGTWSGSLTLYGVFTVSTGSPANAASSVTSQVTPLTAGVPATHSVVLNALLSLVSGSTITFNGYKTGLLGSATNFQYAIVLTRLY